MKHTTTMQRLVPWMALLWSVLAVAPAAADWAAPRLPGDRAEPGLMVEEPPRYGVF